MTANTLREAARLMRERAEAAIQGNEGSLFALGQPDPYDGNISEIFAVADGGERYEVARGLDDRDARHIASWHPAVALAVADWLGEVASMCEEFLIDEDEDPSALAVARAYLGGQR